MYFEKYLKYKKKYLNLKKKGGVNMLVSNEENKLKEEWKPIKYLDLDGRIWIELHKIVNEEIKDIMFIYRSNSGLLWHMYTSKGFSTQVPKIMEFYSTSYLLDLSLQKKINNILENSKDSLENLNLIHNIPKTENRPSRFSFTKYYTA